MRKNLLGQPNQNSLSDNLFFQKISFHFEVKEKYKLCFFGQEEMYYVDLNLDGDITLNPMYKLICMEKE